MADLVVGLDPELALTPEEMLEAAVAWSRRRDERWREVLSAMVECARSGTCEPAGLDGLLVAGKTGTVGFEGSRRTQAWFAGFAPAEAPEAAVVVFLESGRGREAAALAGDALRWYFRR
jgi:cell division protein FtsI/penicillin-binding protein 2